MTEGKKRTVKVVIIGSCLVAVVACLWIWSAREKEPVNEMKTSSMSGTIYSYEQTEDGLVVGLTDVMGATLDNAHKAITGVVFVLITEDTYCHGNTLKNALSDMDMNLRLPVEVTSEYQSGTLRSWHGQTLYPAMMITLDNQPALRYERVIRILFKLEDPFYAYDSVVIYHQETNDLLDCLTALDLSTFETCPKDEVLDCWITGTYTIVTEDEDSDMVEYEFATAAPYLIIDDTAYLLGDDAELFQVAQRVEQEFM